MFRQLFALFNLGLIVGAAAVGIRRYRRSHPDLSAIRGSRLLGPTVRGWYLDHLVPFEEWFARRGVRPAVLSWGQLAAGTVAAAAYAAGLIYTAGFLVLFTGTLDILDGRVARRTGAGSPRGAFLDSVIDRYVEFIGYAGLMVFFRGRWAMWAALLAIFGGMMVSYTRARAEGLGVPCEVGLLQRPERFVILGFGSIASSLSVHLFPRWTGGGHQVLAWTLVLLAVLANWTAVQRAVYVGRRLDAGAA